MKVNIPDKKEKTIAAEMVGGSGEIGTLVGEMVTEPTKLKDFGFSDDIVNRAASIKAALEDDKTEIAVVRVEEGWSRSGRLWPATEIDRIVAQTNELEPVGHLGHIPDDEESTSMPEPQTTWVGAIAKTEPSKLKGKVGEMVRVAYFAGYNHPGAKIRGIIKARGVRGISWWGKANQVPVPGRGVEMRNFDLLALDWARKLSEGMPSSTVVAIAGEMKGTDMAEVDLAQVTPEQFKEGNPNGYALLVKEVEDKHKDTIGEMTAKVEQGDAAQTEIEELRKVLKIDKDKPLLETVTSLMSRLGDKAKELVKAELDRILGEKITDEKTREVVARLVPVGEMESKVADESDPEAAKKLVSEMVDEAFNKDDAIKTLVGEQAPVNVRRREDLQREGGSSLENNDYVTRERVTVG